MCIPTCRIMCTCVHICLCAMCQHIHAGVCVCIYKYIKKYVYVNECVYVEVYASVYV